MAGFICYREKEGLALNHGLLIDNIWAIDFTDRPRVRVNLETMAIY